MLTKMCLSEMYSKAPVGKHLSAAFSVRNGLEEGGALQLCFRLCHWEGGGKPGETEIK
jgi:hypothetical protein